MTGWNPIGCLMDSSDVTILQIVFSLDGRTQIDSQFANANSDDPSASIYAVQIALSVYQKEQ